jgi:hypothetical protein
MSVIGEGAVSRRVDNLSYVNRRPPDGGHLRPFRGRAKPGVRLLPYYGIVPGSPKHSACHCFPTASMGNEPLVFRPLCSGISQGKEADLAVEVRLSSVRLGLKNQAGTRARLLV